MERNQVCVKFAHTATDGKIYQVEIISTNVTRTRLQWIFFLKNCQLLCLGDLFPNAL